MFELTDMWSHGATPEGYCAFLDLMRTVCLGGAVSRMEKEEFEEDAEESVSEYETDDVDEDDDDDEEEEKEEPELQPQDMPVLEDIPPSPPLRHIMETQIVEPIKLKAAAAIPSIGFLGIDQAGLTKKKKKKEKKKEKKKKMDKPPQTEEEMQRRKFGMGMIQSLTALKMVLGVPKVMSDAGAFNMLEQVEEEMGSGDEDKEDSIIDQLATEIFKIADRQTVNNKVTLTEMQSNLIHTRHHKFMLWMMKNRARNFKKFDVDKSYTLSLDEIKEAVTVFLAPDAEQRTERSHGGICQDWFTHHMNQASQMNHVTQSNAESVSDAFSNIMGLDVDLMQSFIAGTTQAKEGRRQQRRSQEVPNPLSGTYPPSHKRKFRKKYLESTVAVRRRMAPACTRSARELGAHSALGHSSWWDPRFPEPMLPPMPGMPARHNIGKGVSLGQVSSPWEHPPSRLLEGTRASAALLETPARCPTPHMVRSHRAPRARGARWVLEGVIKNRSRSVLNDANMSGNWPRSMEDRPRRTLRALPPLPEFQLYEYNMRLRARGLATRNIG